MSKKISEKNLRQVLNYRLLCKDKPALVYKKNLKVFRRIEYEADLQFVIWQSYKIDEMGIDRWFRKTGGPYKKQ